MFKDRTHEWAHDRPDGPPPAEPLLGELLQAKSLRPHQFVRHCEIGPFVVDYVCRERCLIVELTKDHQEARSAFLTAMGYTVIYVGARELKMRPRSVVMRIQAAMQ